MCPGTFGFGVKPLSKRILWLMLLSACLLLTNSNPTHAAAIKSVRLRSLTNVTAPRKGWSYWDRVYLRALGNLSLRPNGPNALRVLWTDSFGRLPDIPMVEYLHWRRSLNPRRFDRNHAELSAFLRQDLYVRSLIHTPITPPSGGVQPGGVNPPGSVPPIPEPSSGLVALVMVLAAMRLFRLKNARKSTPLYL